MVKTDLCSSSLGITLAWLCFGCARVQAHVHQDAVVGPCPLPTIYPQMSAQKPARGGNCRCCEVAVASALLASINAQAITERRAWAAAAPSRLSAIATEMRPEHPGDIEKSVVLPAQAAEYTAREVSLRAQVAKHQRMAEEQSVRPEHCCLRST